MRVVIELYKYFFFKLYSWNLKAFGKNEMPTLNALLHLSLLMYGNIITLILAFKILTGIRLIDFKNVDVVLLVVLSLSVLLFNYFALVYNSRFKMIINQYSGESKESLEKGNNALGWYIGLTIGALILALIFNSFKQ